MRRNRRGVRSPRKLVVPQDDLAGTGAGRDANFSRRFPPLSLAGALVKLESYKVEAEQRRGLADGNVQPLARDVSGSWCLFGAGGITRIGAA